MPQLMITRAVVPRASSSTVLMEMASRRQAQRLLVDRWRHGSPKVLASQPQPQTHEQYQRLPKKKASRGTATNEPRKL